MEDLSDTSLRLVDEYVRSLANRLQLVLKNSRLPGKVSGATQKISQGIFGYVSFSPHQNPEEENIDASILVSLVGKHAKISADICWSDGEIINDFGEYEISYSSMDDFAQEIRAAYSQFEKNVYEKMIELITSNLQPKYRNE